MIKLHKSGKNMGITLVEMLMCMLIISIITLLMLPIMGMFSSSGITGQFIDYSKVGVCRKYTTTGKCDFSKGLKIYSALGSLKYDSPTGGAQIKCRAIKDVADLIKLQNGDSSMPLDGCYVLMDDINFEKTQIINKKGHKERVNINATDFKTNCTNGTYQCELSDYTWSGIGTDEKPFTGKFLGNGKIIYNMKNAPIFKKLSSSAVVQDFGIHNSSYDCSQNARCGFLADHIIGQDSMEIRNVYLSNSSITNSGIGKQAFGGLIGEVGDGSTNPSKLDLVLAYNDSPQEAAGGLIGHSHSIVYFEKCHNIGKITSKYDVSGLRVGGFVGKVGAHVDISLSHNLNGDVEIEDASSSGVTITNKEQVGGFVGIAQGATIEKSWVKANIKQTNSTNSGSSAGGFIGSSGGKVDIKNSYVVGDITSKVHAGGFVGDVGSRPLVLEKVYSIVKAEGDVSSGAIAGKISDNTSSTNVLFYDSEYNLKFASIVQDSSSGASTSFSSYNWCKDAGGCKLSSAVCASASQTCSPYTRMTYSFSETSYDYGDFLANDFEALQLYTEPYKTGNGTLWKNNVYRPILIENPEKVVELAKISENPSGVDTIMFLINASGSMKCSIDAKTSTCAVPDVELKNCIDAGRGDAISCINVILSDWLESHYPTQMANMRTAYGATSETDTFVLLNKTVVKELEKKAVATCDTVSKTCEKDCAKKFCINQCDTATNKTQCRKNCEDGGTWKTHCCEEPDCNKYLEYYGYQEEARDEKRQHCHHDCNKSASKVCQSRWEILKNIMKDLLEEMATEHPDTKIGIRFIGNPGNDKSKMNYNDLLCNTITVATDGSGTLNLEAAPAKDREVKNNIMKIYFPGAGNTYIFPALKAVLTGHSLCDSTAMGKIKKIILIEVGDSNEKELKVLRNDVISKRDDIHIDVIRLGSEGLDTPDTVNESLSKDETGKEKGSYNRTTDPAVLKTAIEKALTSGYTSRKQGNLCLDTKNNTSCTSDLECGDYAGVCHEGCCAIPITWTQHCSSPSDCSPGETCNAAEYCVKSNCTKTCGATTDCGVGEECFAGCCMPEVYPSCTTSDDCSPGKTCSAKKYCEP